MRASTSPERSASEPDGEPIPWCETMTKATLEKSSRRLRRRKRVRGKVSGTAERPRLSIHRSNRGVFAQLIDDERGHTLAAVNWTESSLRSLAPMEKATRAGELLAERARAAGLEKCVFDRSGYRYHGRVKALAEGARSGGLSF
jgi:large subunit ribosomal protein L18